MLAHAPRAEKIRVANRGDLKGWRNQVGALGCVVWSFVILRHGANRALWWDEPKPLTATATASVADCMENKQMAHSSTRPMRRLLSQLISPELRRVRKVAGSRVVRLRADMNTFTAPDDVFGPYTGETALRVVRHALEHATRDFDLVSLTQPDGGEFGLTLRIALDADPQTIRDRIESTANNALAAAGLQDAGDTQIGISIGVTEVGAPVLDHKRARRVHKRRSARTPKRVSAARR